MENYNVKEVNGLLVKEKINKNMTNLHNKTFMELNADELHREIDYLWGMYDYVSQSEYLPEDIRNKQGNYLWKQLDIYTNRYLHLSLKSIRNNMDDMTDELREMRCK